MWIPRDISSLRRMPWRWGCGDRALPPGSSSNWWPGSRGRRWQLLYSPPAATTEGQRGNTGWNSCAAQTHWGGVGSKVEKGIKPENSVSGFFMRGETCGRAGKTNCWEKLLSQGWFFLQQVSWEVEKKRWWPDPVLSQPGDEGLTHF